MSEYANMLNKVLGEAYEQLRTYGGLLAQAGIPLEDDALADDKYVRQGYRQQLNDFPNG